MINYDVNEKAKEVFAYNQVAGWEPEECNLHEKLQMVSTEIAEATEGLRKDLMDDKLPHRKMYEVELADALIRMYSFGGRLELDYTTDNIIEDSAIGYLSGMSQAEQLFHLNTLLADIGRCIYSNHVNKHKELNDVYSCFIFIIYVIGKLNDLDITQAMIEKEAFNQTREDHKPEVRAKEGGKAF